MSRVLRDAAVGLQERPVGAAGDPLLAGPLKDFLQEAVGRAREEGRRAGFDEGYTAATASSNRLGASVRAGFEQGIELLRRRRLTEATDSMALALEIAYHVLGREASDDSVALIERVRDALAEIDDSPLTVSVSRADHEAAAAALAPNKEVEVLADPTLQPGEARVQGPWARADLTRAAAWNAVREALGVGEP